MLVEPAIEAFATTYQSGQSQIVYTKLVADLETPVSAMLKIAADRPNCFLLESVEGGVTRGRYSIIGLKPDIIWRCNGNYAEINRRANDNPDAFTAETKGALDSLRQLLTESRIELPETLPPMSAGLVGYMGYETVQLMEIIPDSNPRAIELPDGLFIRPTVMAIFDSVQDTVTVVTPVRPTDEVDAKTAYAHAIERLERVSSDFARDLPIGREVGELDFPTLQPSSNMSREGYCRAVEAAKEYIAAGDIFQVVLSQRFSLPFTLPPFALYRALRRLNPSPFLFYLSFSNFSVVGSSPEILVRLRDNTVTIRPIAGTRKRGMSRAEDQALAKDLLADPKERAEHLMLLDLGRNDVGRVAKIGSVNVTEQMMIEYYSHVMHLVSNVEGEIDPKFDAIAALIAGFPAGTVSGAPKIRAMEIIDELENEKRGIYAGCVGYFAANGAMDTCIALRTAVIKDEVMYIQAGGGIVADSDPEAEYEESCNKAQALIQAAEEAVNFATKQS
ncbi:MAG: anthranilate synthase component I [Alphaproteobacteria bacterium]